MPTKVRSAAAQKAHDKVFASIVEGAKQAISIAKGEADPATYRVHVPFEVDVKAVRAKTGLSQNEFAGSFGFAPGTLRDWEQKRAKPDQAVRAYLYVIGEKPDMVRKMLKPLTGAVIAAARPKRRTASVSSR